MAKMHIYQQLNLKTKINKQNRNRTIDTFTAQGIEQSKNKKNRQNHGYGEGFDGSQMGRGYGGVGEEVRGLRSTNRQLYNSHGGKVHYRKQSSRRTYTHDPWT